MIHDKYYIKFKLQYLLKQPVSHYMFYYSYLMVGDLTLQNDLAQMGAKAVLHVLQNFHELHKKAIPQPAEGKTLAPKIHANTGVISWELQTVNVCRS